MRQGTGCAWNASNAPVNVASARKPMLNATFAPR